MQSLIEHNTINRSNVREEKVWTTREIIDQINYLTLYCIILNQKLGLPKSNYNLLLISVPKNQSDPRPKS